MTEIKWLNSPVLSVCCMFPLLFISGFFPLPSYGLLEYFRIPLWFIYSVLNAAPYIGSSLVTLGMTLYILVTYISFTYFEKNYEYYNFYFSHHPCFSKLKRVRQVSFISLYFYSPFSYPPFLMFHDSFISCSLIQQLLWAILLEQSCWRKILCSFPFSEKNLISSFLKDSFTGCRSLSWCFCFFQYWKMLYHFLLASIVYGEKSTRL